MSSIAADKCLMLDQPTRTATTFKSVGADCWEQPFWLFMIDIAEPVIWDSSKMLLNISGCKTSLSSVAIQNFAMIWLIAAISWSLPRSPSRLSTQFFEFKNTDRIANKNNLRETMSLMLCWTSEIFWNKSDSVSISSVWLFLFGRRESTNKLDAIIYNFLVNNSNSKNEVVCLWI